MHKKAKKIVSVLLTAAMLLSSSSAFAFSFDDYDSEAGDRFVADYYANKESYYQTDNKVTRFPAYAQPHKLYTDAEMQNEGIHNFIPEVSSEIGAQIQAAGGDNRVVNRWIKYEDAGAMGSSQNFSDHDVMSMAYLSRNFVGASQILIPYYPLQRCFNKDPADINITEYTELYNFWLTPDLDGRYSTMASFYPDGDGTIYYVTYANARGFDSRSEWEKISQDMSKSLMYNKLTGKPGEQEFADSNKNYPVTLINDIEYSWTNLQQMAKMKASAWLDSEAGMPYSYEHERVLTGTNSAPDGRLDVGGILYVYKMSFTAGQLVELPTPAAKGGYGTFLIRWNDRQSEKASLDALGYKINGEGETISVPSYNPNTETYTVDVGYGAAFATIEASGAGEISKPDIIDFTDGSATADVAVKTEHAEETYTIEFTAPQFESALSAPDAISYLTPKTPNSNTNESEVLVDGYHETSQTTEFSIKLFANQAATEFKAKKPYDTNVELTEADSSYPYLEGTAYRAFNMTTGEETWNASVGDTVKILASRTVDDHTYKNVYTIHVGQFAPAYGYNDGNITITPDVGLKTVGPVVVNPSALDARVPLFSDRYPQHVLAFAGEYVKGATHIALPLNDSTRSSDEEIKAYHAGDNKYFAVTAKKPGTIYLAASAGDVSKNHTEERGWKKVADVYTDFTNEVVNANDKYTGGVNQLTNLTGADISDSFALPLGFYRIQYGETINGVYRVGDSVTPKNRIDRTRKKNSAGVYEDKVCSATANQISNRTMVYRHFEAGEEVQIYTMGSSENENLIPFIVWDDATAEDINGPDKVKDLTLNADFCYTYMGDADTAPKQDAVKIYGGDGLPGSAYYSQNMAATYGLNYVVEDDIVLGEGKTGDSTLVYSDRNNRFLSQSNTSEYFSGGTIIRRPKGETGPLKFDTVTDPNGIVIEGSKGQPFFTGAYSGKNGEPYWMSFTVTSGATVFTNTVNGTWYNAPEDWTKADENSLKLADKNVYYRHFNAGETVNIPNYGWDDSLPETTTYWDPTTYVIVWDSQGKVNPDTLSGDASIASITVNGETVPVFAEQTAYTVEVDADTMTAELAVTPTESGATVLYGDEEATGSSYLVASLPAEIPVKVKAPKGNIVEYTFTFTQAVQQVHLAVGASGGTIQAVVGEEPSADWSTGKEVDFARGTKIVLTAAADAEYTFLYWLDKDSGRIVSDQAEYSFYLGSDRNLEAVFAPAATDETKTVVFKNKNNQIVLYQQVQADGSVVVPENPSYTGRIFGGWLKDNAMSSIKAGDTLSYDRLAAGSTIYTAGYAKASDKYAVTVSGGTLADGTTSGSYAYDTLLTVTLDKNAVPEGKKFAYWTKEGKTVSYNETYSFYMGMTQTAVEAVYVDETVEVVKEPVIVAYEPIVMENGKIAFFSERSLDNSYTLVESGILLYNQPGHFDITTDGVIKAVGTSTANDGQYTIRKANVSGGETWYAKAYMIYLDGNGAVHYVFSDTVEESYPIE